MKIVKRTGNLEEFNFDKISKAILFAFRSVNKTEYCPEYRQTIVQIQERLSLEQSDTLSIETVQDIIETVLFESKVFDVAKSYILYRERHRELRFIKERAEYIESYSNSEDNAATVSEIDSNANIQNKNVATLEAELYKTSNADLSRYRIVKKLKELYGVDSPDYIGDLESHVIYKHDEGSAPAIKPYCVAVSLYPFLIKGTSTLDKLNTQPPHNLNSFTGQFNNLVFLLSSQFQGAVAFGEFFNVFSYYCSKEWGSDFYKKDSVVVTKTEFKERTISDTIEQAFQNIVYTINQPAGNRGYQSPFVNISYYDKYYWEALFSEFVFPDGTKLDWLAVDYLQRKFLKWFNKERSKCLLTFPVETISVLSDKKTKKLLDSNYRDLIAEMYSEGHSFFTYHSDNPDALSSCCRVRNEIETNEFSFTNGLTGVATGSKSVITLNLNRLIQNWSRESLKTKFKLFSAKDSRSLVSYIETILERVYKYHHAYNELLWDLYRNNMLPVYSEGYISLNQQFLTIGLNGLNEAAEFLGLRVSDNSDYQRFCNLITETISLCNKKHRSQTLKFNSEFVPAENLGVKNYNWDKRDGYWVPEGRNCYNSYFYKPEDDSISVLEKFRLHGERYTSTLDGGVALHCNLEEHLSKEQYLKLLDYSVEQGTSYITYNIPNSQCENCGYISKQKISRCPKCQSSNITWWTRIIGYLRPIKSFSKGRRIEASKRVYSKNIE